MKPTEPHESGKRLTRELALVRVAATGRLQDQALDVVGAWSGRLLELAPSHFTVELSGPPDKVSRFLLALKPFGSITSSRTGALALEV